MYTQHLELQFYRLVRMVMILPMRDDQTPRRDGLAVRESFIAGVESLSHSPTHSLKQLVVIVVVVAGVEAHPSSSSRGGFLTLARVRHHIMTIYSGDNSNTSLNIQGSNTRWGYSSLNNRGNISLLGWQGEAPLLPS